MKTIINPITGEVQEQPVKLSAAEAFVEEQLQESAEALQEQLVEEEEFLNAQDENFFDNEEEEE